MSTRRNAPEPPDEAKILFGSALATAEEFAGHLATTAIEYGLIGPRELPRLWDRHILNCAVGSHLVGEGSTVADVGSGAGLPGLVLAIRRPDLGITLIESLQRRSEWLTETVNALGLENVEIVRARAEELAGTREFDIVTARAVASMAGLVPFTLPLTRPHGRLLAYKGANAEREVAKAAQPLRSFGAVSTRIAMIDEDVLATPTTIVEVTVGKNGGKIPGRKRRKDRQSR